MQRWLHTKRSASRDVSMYSSSRGGNADRLVLPDGLEQEDRDRKFGELAERQEKELRGIGRNIIRSKSKLEPDVNAPNYQTPGAKMR
jgi:hypothetical protein